jgi:hypothetical protein
LAAKSVDLGDSEPCTRSRSLPKDFPHHDLPESAEHRQEDPRLDRTPAGRGRGICVAGLLAIADGLAGRRALLGGLVGTFTPTDRACGRYTCKWVGTFTSTDGTVTAKDVKLNGTGGVRRNGPMPFSIDNVRLDDEANRPAAYTTDYNWHAQVIKGAVAALGLPPFLVIIFIRGKRHRRRQMLGHQRFDQPPPGVGRSSHP